MLSLALTAPCSYALINTRLLRTEMIFKTRTAYTSSDICLTVLPGQTHSSSEQHYFTARTRECGILFLSVFNHAGMGHEPGHGRAQGWCTAVHTAGRDTHSCQQHQPTLIKPVLPVRDDRVEPLAVWPGGTGRTCSTLRATLPSKAAPIT